MQSVTARGGQIVGVEGARTREFPWVAGVALVTFLLHGLTSGGYGYFRDEFYYLACSDRLAAGYVDHPPLSIWLLAGSRWLLGDSLLALHFLPALATALLVLVTGHLTRVLGGGRWAQALAAVAAAVAPVYLVVGNFYSMNAFEPLLWTVGALIVVHLIHTDDARWWLALGLVIGLGLENKHSMLFFGLGLSVAVVATPLRRHLFRRWVWLGALVALVLFLPNLLWQFRYGFPTLEFMRNAQLFKNAPLSLTQFVGQQILMVHPVTLPLWLAGLCWYFATSAGRRYRALGWIYVVVFALLVLQRGKAYYLAPAYPPLLAAGAIAFATWTDRRARWLRSAYLALLLAGGFVLAPLGLPILPADTLVGYARALGVQEGVKAETNELGQLPQHFADMFGWSEMVDTVADVYNRLPADDRARCAIYAQNYGEAGAIDFLGRTHGLPHALSGHNNYWLWGPGNVTGEVVIVVGGSAADLAGFCETVEQVAVTHCRYCMPFENNRPIFLCRNHQGRLQQIWAQLKRYI
ncbi:MAG: glycosyltransferase family 39 protein [Deltaproteobacteria bacterium]|nr:glycosyltransferase family 39 protein [Deltaproteobacteria bacterium]MBI3387923.1 glycosyltransferase family 39 protein [Deltaproteobacteria bacterium]